MGRANTTHTAHHAPPDLSPLSRQDHVTHVSVRRPLARQRSEGIITISRDKAKNTLVTWECCGVHIKINPRKQFYYIKNYVYYTHIVLISALFPFPPPPAA